MQLRKNTNILSTFKSQPPQKAFAKSRHTVVCHAAKKPAHHTVSIFTGNTKSNFHTCAAYNNIALKCCSLTFMTYTPQETLSCCKQWGSVTIVHL